MCCMCLQLLIQMKFVTSLALLAYQAMSRYPVMQPLTIAEYVTPQMTHTLEGVDEQTWTCPYSSYVVKQIRMLFDENNYICGLELIFEINHIQRIANAVGWPNQSFSFGCEEVGEMTTQSMDFTDPGDQIVSIIAYRDAEQGLLSGLKVKSVRKGDVMLGTTDVSTTTWNFNGRRFIGADVTIIGVGNQSRIAALTPKVVSFSGDCNKQEWLPPNLAQLKASSPYQNPIEVLIGSPGFQIKFNPQSAQTINHCQLEVIVAPTEGLNPQVFADGTVHISLSTEDTNRTNSSHVSYYIEIKNFDSLTEFRPVPITDKTKFQVTLKYILKFKAMPLVVQSPFTFISGKVGTNTALQLNQETQVLKRLFYKLRQIQFASRSATQSNGFMAEFVNTDPAFEAWGWTPFQYYYGSFFGTITTTNIPADREVVGYDICFDPNGSLMHIHLELDNSEILKIGLSGCLNGTKQKLSGRIVGFQTLSEHEPDDLNSPNSVRRLKVIQCANECATTSYTIAMGNKDATTAVDRVYKRSETIGKIQLGPITHTYSTIFPDLSCTHAVTWTPSYYVTLSTNKLELQYESTDYYGIGTTTYSIKVQDSSQASFVTDFTTETLYVGYRENFYTLPSSYKKEIKMPLASCLYDGSIVPPILKKIAVSLCVDQTQCLFDAVRFTLNNGINECSFDAGKISTTSFAQNQLYMEKDSFNKVFMKVFLNTSTGLYQIGQIGQNLNKVGAGTAMPGHTDYTRTFYLTETQRFCGIEQTVEIATGFVKMFDPIVCTPNNRYATKFAFNLRIEACGATCQAFQASNEVINQIEPPLMIMNGNELKSVNLWDTSLTTSFDSLETNLNPYITIDFMASVNVEAVYIHTIESIMIPTTGKFIVLVGDQPKYNDMDLSCPNMSGVGINSVGGVFNCSRQGRYFMIYCVTQCRMSMAMVRVWQTKALSHLGTLTIFKEFQTGYSTLTNLDFINKKGSLSCSSKETSINVQRTIGNTSQKPYFQVDLGYDAKITQFMAITWQEELDTYLYVSSDPMTSAVTTTNTNNRYSYDSSKTNKKGYTSAAFSSTTGRYAAYWREKSDIMSLCKLVILGTYCHDSPLTFETTAVWPTLTVEFANSEFVATPPVPDQGCVNINQKGYKMDFAIGQGQVPVTWMTYDQTKNEIKAFLTTSNFNIWQGRTEQVQVTITRTIAGSPRLVLTPMQIKFAGKVDPCGVSCSAFDKTAEVISQLQPDLIQAKSEVLTSSYLNDQDLKTVYLSDVADLNPYLRIDFNGVVKVEAVLIHTDETVMNGGTFTIDVDVGGKPQRCPNMNGVGAIQAIGGVFNCGLEGTHFQLTCDQCRIAIKMLYIWQLPSLAHEANITFGAGNKFATGYVTNTDLNKLLGLGSYGCADRTQEVSISQGTNDVAGIQIDLKHNAILDQFLYLSSQQYKGGRFAATAAFKDITTMLYTNTSYICWYYGQPGDNNKGLVMTKCQKSARYVAMYQTNQTSVYPFNDFMICKLVVIGKFCHHMPLTFSTEFQWPIIQILAPNKQVSFTPPIPEAGCTQLDDLRYSLTFRFLDDTSDISYFTYDYDKKILQILVPMKDYLQVNGKTIELRGTYQRALPGSPPFTFLAKFEFFNAVDIYCKESTLIPSDEKLPDFTITVNQKTVLSFMLPEIKDQASLDTGDSSGVVNCGPRIYSLIGDQQFLYTPNPQKPREIIVSSSTDKNVGFHGDVAALVTLQNYPTVAALKIPFTVTVKPCVVLGIVPKTYSLKPSAMYIITELPHKIQFTRYTTVPDCFYPTTDFEYKVMLADGSPLPQWASLDQSGPLLELYLEKGPTDQTIQFMYQTYFTKMETSISMKFTLQLMTGNKETPESPPVVETSESPSTEAQDTTEPNEDKTSENVEKQEQKKPLNETDANKPKSPLKDPDAAQTQQPVWAMSDTVDKNAIQALYSVPIKDYVNYLKATTNVDSTWTGWTELLNAKQNKQKKQSNQIVIAPTARIS